MWMIIQNWKSFLVAGLIASLLLTCLLLNRAWNQVAEKIAVIESMKREATQYREKSETIARQINEQHQTLVEQAKKDAYKNYLAKYGRNAACGLRIPTSLNETRSASESDEGTADPVSDPIRETVEQCAVTTSMVISFQKWVKENELEVR